MAISPSQPLLHTVIKEPWYRRTTVVVIFALIAAVAGWVSGLFQLPFLGHPTQPLPSNVA